MRTTEQSFPAEQASSDLMGTARLLRTLRSHESGAGGLLIVWISLTKSQQVTKRNSAGQGCPVRPALNKLGDSLAGDGSGLGRLVTASPVGQRG
jgi:hypothetical protein